MESLSPLVVAEYPTPLGPVAVVATPDDGAVVASAIGPLTSLIANLPPSLAARGVEAGELPAIEAAVLGWASGQPRALDAIKVRQEGGPFQQRVWAAMRRIPPGTTATYGELAAEAGNPKAARAAGHACATNQNAPFVPCHRVVSSTGLGRYGFGGPEAKARVLRLEGWEPSARQSA